MIEAALREIRYAVRILRRSPGFAFAAILTLGISIGANTAVFSVVDATLLRSLPYPQPDRLALVSTVYPGAAADAEDIAQSGRMWFTIRDYAKSVDAAPFSDWLASINLAADNGATRVRQQRVGAGFFRVLGVQPMFGREFRREEDVPNGPAYAVLSHALWMRIFNGDKSVLGTQVMLRGEPHSIIGVMPADFRSSGPADVWTPLRPSTRGEGGGTNYAIAARLKGGSTWEQARSEIASVGQGGITPDAGYSKGVRFSLTSLQRGLTTSMRRPLLILWAAVAAVLLIACVNLASLQLARASRRTREIATRMALGGGRLAVVRQLFFENVVLALLGGAVGLLIGRFGATALVALGRDALGIWQPVSLDARVLGATFALAVLSAVLFGLVPAWQASRLDVHAAIAEEGSRGIASRAHHWPKRLLVVGEVALGVVLLVAAGLLVRTFVHLNQLNPGFDPHGVVTASVSLEDARYRNPERVSRLFTDTVTRLHSTPGVTGAAVSLGLPYERLLNTGFRAVDAPPDRRNGQITNMSYVTPGFFETLRIPLRAGRMIQESDTAASQPVAVVNDTFVSRCLRGLDPLTQRIASGNSTRQIVGVVGSVQQRPGFDNAGPLSSTPTVYVPATQTSAAFLTLVHQWFSPKWIVRTTGPHGAAFEEIRRAVRAADPLLPVGDTNDMEEVQAASLGPQRFMMTLIATLGSVALLLAALGIHGLIAGSVVERTRELGIRLALGSTRWQAMREVAIPGLTMAIAGIAIGLVLAIGTTGLLRHFLWGVTTKDPLTFAAVGGVLFVVAAVASVLPALRVLRLDPADTLRHE